MQFQQHEHLSRAKNFDYIRTFSHPERLLVASHNLEELYVDLSAPFPSNIRHGLVVL